MVIARGDIHWVDLEPASDGDHRPANRRPVLVVQADAYNASRLATAVVVALTARVGAAGLPGNVLLPAAETGLPRDSVAAVSQLLTLNRYELDLPAAGRVPAHLLAQVDDGVALVLGLALRRP